MSDKYLRQVQAELKQFRNANTTNLKRIAELETQHATLLANVGELIDAITAEGGWGEGVMDAMVVISPDKFVDIEQERKG